MFLFVVVIVFLKAMIVVRSPIFFKFYFYFLVIIFTLFDLFLLFSPVQLQSTFFLLRLQANIMTMGNHLFCELCLQTGGYGGKIRKT